MGSPIHALRMLFFPFVSHGHMIPMVELAKLFAARGADVTILTTPANAAIIRSSVKRGNSSSTNAPITIHIIPFPTAAAAAAGLPDGCENLFSIPSKDLILNLCNAVAMIRDPFDNFLEELNPDGIVIGAFLPWAYDVAAKRGIPQISFHGSCFFAECAVDSFFRHQLLESLPPDAESLVIPDLPHRIDMLPSQFSDPKKISPSVAGLNSIFEQALEVERKSMGMVFNSFYELEPDYVEHFRNVMGRKAWHIGPLSICSQEDSGKSSRGGSSRKEECLKWLDDQRPGSVLYVCFGSMGDFSAAQLRELALGLEASGHPFVWAMRNESGEGIPEGFDEIVEGRGLVIRGWAPQLLILNHSAVGGFLTHCGWNSSLEGISAGLPFVTWPLYAEQFYNERLLVDLLEIGVAVGSKVYTMNPEDRPVVEGEKVQVAVKRLMADGEEAEERRRRARALGEKARAAVDLGGSSYNDLSNLMQEIMQAKRGA